MPSAIPTKRILAVQPADRPRNRWASAVRHLRRVDPHLRVIIDRIGPCRLQPYPDRFGSLVRSIVGQQISTRAAASIHQRLLELGGEPHHPGRLIELGETGSERPACRRRRLAIS